MMKYTTIVLNSMIFRVLNIHCVLCVLSAPNAVCVCVCMSVVDRMYVYLLFVYLSLRV